MSKRINRRTIWQNKKVISKSKIQLLLGIAIVILVLFVTDIGCPFRTFIGISCPGCGITRAWVSVLNLDIQKAFYYHPLFWLIGPGFLYIIIGKKPLFHTKRNETIFLITFVSLSLLVYAYRLIDSNSEIVYWSPKEGLLFTLIRRFAIMK